MSYWPYEVPRLIARSGIRLLINGRKTNCECNCLLILNGNPHSLFFNLLANKDINCYGKCTYLDTWMEWWAKTFLLDAQRLYFFKTGLDPWITLDLSIIIKKIGQYVLSSYSFFFGLIFQITNSCNLKFLRRDNMH